MILEDSEPSAGLELLVVQSHKVGLGLFDLEVHLLVQSLDSIDFISFHIIDFLHTFFLLNLKGFLSVLHFLGNLVSEFLSTLLIVQLMDVSVSLFVKDTELLCELLFEGIKLCFLFSVEFRHALFMLLDSLDETFVFSSLLHHSLFIPVSAILIVSLLHGHSFL